MSSAALARPSTLSSRAREMIDCGRLLAARPLVAAFARAAPESLETVELEVRLLAREGRGSEALDRLVAGRTRFGGTTLAILGAELRLQSGDASGAAADAADAVIGDPTNVSAKALLGLALGRAGQFKDGLTCLVEAIAACPSQLTFRQALAEILERSGDRDAAAAVLAQALQCWPANAGLYLAAAMTAMRQRNFVHVFELCEAARRAGVADACLFGLQGHALSSIGRHAEAGEAYGEARKLAPEDPYVRHLAAASGILQADGRAPAAYVETVFDGYADRFEQHLVDLGYRVPGLLRAALVQHRPATQLGDVLDLGCGTGFMAVAISDLQWRRLVGVDLSAGMLAHARLKDLYSELRQSDFEATLANAEEVWDVMLASDSFSYCGDLSVLLRSAQARLRPGGICLFSLEALPQDEAGQEQWQLLRKGRYVHSEPYLREICETVGLEALAIDRQVLRHEAGAPVEGLIAVLERPGP